VEHDALDGAPDLSGGSLLLRALNQMSETVLETVEESLALVEGDEARASFLESISARMPGVFDEAADRLVVDLFESAPAMLAGYEVLEDAYSDELAERCGEAFGVYRMLWVACHETGEAFSLRHFNVDGYEPAPMLHAQVGLQARACRVALEVFALLRSGLGAGALARARTLHEIAVVSAILAKYGAPDGRHPDLAERYLLHADVVTWLDAEEYQEVAPKLGFAPFTDDEMAEMRADRDGVVGTYGEPFGRANGWAACLVENGKAPNGFKALELLAGADHMRSYYSMASHEVHADAKSWVLNHETIGDVTFRSTGPSPRGMADAGQIALIALNQVTVNASPDIDERFGDILAILVLNKLVERACDEFAATGDVGGDE
jgi:Family of unknown function (DUF5677)